MVRRAGPPAVVRGQGLRELLRREARVLVDVAGRGVGRGSRVRHGRACLFEMMMDTNAVTGPTNAARRQQRGEESGD